MTRSNSTVSPFSNWGHPTPSYLLPWPPGPTQTDSTGPVVESVSPDKTTFLQTPLCGSRVKPRSAPTPPLGLIPRRRLPFTLEVSSHWRCRTGLRCSVRSPSVALVLSSVVCDFDVSETERDTGDLVRVRFETGGRGGNPVPTKGSEGLSTGDPTPHPGGTKGVC